MSLALTAAILTWTLPPGGAEPDGFRVYVCTPGDPGEFRVHREVVEGRELEVEAGLYRVTALYHGQPVMDSEGNEIPSEVESALSEPILVEVTPDPEPAPRVRYVFELSNDLGEWEQTVIIERPRGARGFGRVRQTIETD